MSAAWAPPQLSAPAIRMAPAITAAAPGMTAFPRPCIIRRTLPSPDACHGGEKLRPNKGAQYGRHPITRDHAPPLNSKLRASADRATLGGNPAYIGPARGRRKKM